MAQDNKSARYQDVTGKTIDCEAPTAVLQRSLLSEVLRMVRARVYQLEPAIEHLISSQGFTQVAGEYATLLSELDDIAELTDGLGTPSKGYCAANLATIAQNFTEGFAYRFGYQASATVLVATHHMNPVVSTYPSELIRVLDGVVRAFRRIAPDQEVSIAITTNQTHAPEAEVSAAILAIKGPTLPGAGVEIANYFNALPQTPTIHAVPPFGLDLAASLRLAARLGATLEVTAPTATTTAITLSFPVIAPPQHVPGPIVPVDFFFYSKNPRIAHQLQDIAKFHGVTATPISTPRSRPPGKPLVYDAENVSPETALELSSLSDKDNIAILLPVAEVTILRELSRHGFKHFVDFPLVSGRVFRALTGFDQFVAASSKALSFNHAKLKILLVDDTATARVAARDYLESQGHTVSEANDGLELIHRVEKGERFDLIFCDLTMCHVDGVTALKKVREYEKQHGGRTPAILVTTYTEIAAEERAHEAGFDQVLRKPLDAKMIDQMIKEFALPNHEEKMLTPTQIIDLEDLRSRCGGKTKTMVAILEAFLAESKECLSQLRAPELHGNQKAAARLLHTIRGNLLDAGAKTTANLVKEIETQLKQSEYVLAQDLPRLQGILESVWRDVERIKDELPTQ